MTPARVLGIEIGGTKLQLAVGAGDGSALDALERLDVDRSRGAAGIRERIERTGRTLLAAHRVERIGIGFGGPVRAGRVTTSHQVSGWDDFPLVEWCRETFGLPAVLGNDCDAAALAEARLGAGRGRRSVFFVTVGTGIGGGVVIDGQLVGADRPAIAEIGHLRPGLEAVTPDRTVEALAAGPGIEAAVRRRLRDPARGAQDDGDVDHLLRLARGDLDALSTRVIAEAAAAGNRLARDAMRTAARGLGWAIAQVVTLLAPEVVVVGGGVSLSDPSVFLDPLRDAVAEYVFPPLADSYSIEPAALGEQVVLYGALALAAGAL
jgi:glucokinase